MNHQNVFPKFKVEVSSQAKIYGTLFLCDRCLMLGYKTSVYEKERKSPAI